MAQATDKSDSSSTTRPRLSTAKTVLFLLAVVILSGCQKVYMYQPDALAGLTVWPGWMWIVLSWLLSAISLMRKRPAYFVIMTVLSVVYLPLVSEEPWSLARSLMPQRTAPSTTLRIVSVNCAGGTAAAALETRRLHPDIVLLQESPGADKVAHVARSLFGRSASYITGMDSSIISRYPLEKQRLPVELAVRSAAARVRWQSSELFVVSTHLSVAPFRYDFWTRDYWSSFRDVRERHREQVQLLAGHVSALPRQAPVVVGGDFNSPAHDGAFSPFKGLMRDSFRSHGRGWGNTFLNSFPVIRIDQIWISKALHAVRVRAVRTDNSDHRMVVAEIFPN
ncbi:MAG: endonuclease/exonuclease/phosphatase family protein [Armatimonadetes bacterium]|nr:endonuclease/exonuclease/phosphatase family protein [Armatimonadota bacterium]